MPTATFTADFRKWNEALRDAQAGLKPLEVSAKGVQQQLQKMATSLSGANIQKQAQIAVAAVQAVGGVTKLTTAEQARLNATVTEAIAKYKALGQQAPQDMKDLAAATKEAAESAGKNTQSVRELAAGYVAGLVTFEAAKAALGGIVDFLDSSLQSYASAEAASKRLFVALKNQGNATPQVISQYDALAAEFQKTTTFSDDLITEMEALFTQVGKVGPDQMKAALAASTDLAEGLGIDLQQAVEAVAKASEGQTKALHKLAPSLDEATLKGGDLSAILAEIEKHFGGQAQAQVDTYAGRIKQLANDWDNVKEAIGGAIANDASIKALLRGLTEGLRDANSEAGQLSLSQLLINQLMRDGNVVFAEIVVKINEYAEASNKAAEASRLLAQAKNQTPDLGPDKPVSTLPAGFIGELQAAQKAIADLTAEQKKQIDSGLKLHESAENIAKSLNDQYDGLKLTAQAVQLYDDAQKKAAENTKKGAKAIDDQREALAAVKDDLFKVADALGKIEEKNQALDFADEVSDLKAQLDQVENRINKVSSAETEWIEGSAHLLVNKSTVVKDYFAVLLKHQEDSHKGWEQFAQDIDDLSRAFAELSQISGGTLGDILSVVGKIVGSANLAVKSIDSITKGYGKLHDANHSLKDNIGGFAELASGILSAAAAAVQFGKALFDALNHSRPEQLQSSVMHDFGVEIGEDLGKTIANSAIEEFGGSFQAAQIGNLDKIISAGGGIDFHNFDKLEARLHDVFSLLQTGELSAAQAQDVLNKNFKTFVDFLGGDVNPELKEIIRLNQQFGTQSKAILDYVAQNADKAASGFNKIATNILTLVTGFQSGSDDMKRLQEAINGVAGSTGKLAKEAPEAHRGIEELKRAAKGGGFADEFIGDLRKELDRLGPIAEASFGALLAGGKSVTEALAELAPGLQKIEDVVTATGEHADGFLGKVIGWEDVVEKNKELFDILSGVDDMLKGLNNAGALTQDAFAGLTATVSDAFGQLTIQGVSATDAIMLMQPQLQEIWELQKDFGYAVDDSTQKLIDQAVTAGEVGEKHRSIQEQTLDVMKHLDDVLTGIGQKFGVDIPNDVAKTGDAFRDAKGDLDDFVGGIPKNVHIPVKLDYPEGPDGGYPGGGSYPTTYAAGGPVYAASGYFAPKGTDTVPAMLTPGEFVMSRSAVERIGAGNLASMNRGIGGGSVTGPSIVILQIDGREIGRAIAPSFPNQVRRLGVRVRT